MRTQRQIVWPYLLLSLALLGALGFGWYQTRQKNQLSLDAENKYMAAFHKLKWNSENMEERTANLMATSNPRLQESLLSDLRVYSAQAVSEMSVLPFTTLHTPAIEAYLKNLSTKSDEYHDKLNRGEKLSPDDWRQIAELRRQSVIFEGELGTLLGLVGNNHLRWADTVKATSMRQSGAATTPVTQSIAQMEKALVAPTPEAATAPPDTMPRPRQDPGPRVDAAQAAAAVKAFVDMPLHGEPKLTGLSDPADKGTSFSLYFFSGQKANGTPLDFGVSVHGGHVIYMMDGREVREKRFTVPQLVEKARRMLKGWGYPDEQLVSTAMNDGTLVMDFAPLEHGVAIQTELIKVMLATDNAELAGFDARNFWINRYARSFGQPQLSPEAAVHKVSPRLQVSGTPVLSLIADRRHQERLVWEVPGRVDDQHFRVFIDAANGQEIDVQRVAGDPAPPLNEGTPAPPARAGAPAPAS